MRAGMAWPPHSQKMKLWRGLVWALMTNEAQSLSFSCDDARQLALIKVTTRGSIDGKHASYEPERETQPRKDSVESFGQELVDEPMETGIEIEDLWEYANPPEPTYAELGLPEPDRVVERIDKHRKLTRYEQRAVNQIRKAARIKK